jgi:hypothetical protein
MKTRIPLFLIAVLIVYFALLPIAQAAPVPNPPAPGVLNTRDGQSAMPFVSTGVANSAFGAFSLFSNTTGNNNTAVGVAALDLNNADNNTAVGTAALLLNTTGSSNTAVGVSALLNNDTGFFNTATGEGSLGDNTEGAGNTAIGYFALNNTTTGSGNIAIGVSSGSNLTVGDNNIYIGNVGAPGDSNTTRIGFAKTTERNFIVGIRGVTTGVNDAVNVMIDSAGQLGTVSSSRRFKKEIKAMDKASEAILGLKPVTFHYKGDKANRREFGLIAEEVADVNPDLVVRDENGEIYTVRYDAVNAMLLNEFLKEHRKNEEQEATIARQQKQIEALTAGLQRVSAQIELSKPVPQLAENNQ